MTSSQPPTSNPLPSSLTPTDIRIYRAVVSNPGCSFHAIKAAVHQGQSVEDHWPDTALWWALGRAAKKGIIRRVRDRSKGRFLGTKYYVCQPQNDFELDLLLQLSYTFYRGPKDMLKTVALLENRLKTCH